MYFVNHILIVFLHRRHSLVLFSCNRCVVQCVSSGVELDDDDDGGEDDGDHDDDDGGGDFNGKKLGPYRLIFANSLALLEFF